MGKRIEVKAGDRHGRLTAIEEVEPQISPKGRIIRQVQCVCNCGSVCVVSLYGWRGNHSRSCGCLKREAVARTGRAHKRHGFADSGTYYSWAFMKRRCYDFKHPSYHQYGGRGVTVCNRWRHSIEAFVEDMGERPSSEYSIDRIDNDGNYEPGNCRWATRQQQARNTSRNVLLTHDGTTKCLAAWVEDTGINRSTIRRRLRDGWTVADALTMPARRPAK